MSKKGYLTAAEYRAMRTLLGFSQQEAAEFHKVQNLRTIQRWEKGASFVSELACDKITALFDLINAQIDAALDQAVQAAAKVGGNLEVTLIIYPDSCYRKFVIGIGDLPNSVHKQMIFRLYSELKGRGVNAGIVEFQPQDYFIFLAAKGLKDGHDARSAWAVDFRKRCMN